MKNIMKCVVAIITLLIGTNVYANDIKSIDMDIYLDKTGNATITETWNIFTDSGTEVYKYYEYLGESNISNLKVSMNKQNFTALDYWDIDGSFEDKKYKSGINIDDDRVELCFGISNYGNNTYTFSYEISNFVVSNKDKDMIYWTLIQKDLSDKPEKFYIKIHKDSDFSDTDEVWGYGYTGGYAYVYDGIIEMTKESNFGSDEYVVLLAEFPLNTFTTSVTLDNDSKYYEDMAADGTTSPNNKTSIIEIITAIISIGAPIAICVIVAFLAANSTAYGTRKLMFNKNKRKFGKDVLPFRDIPFNKDIYAAYWISGNYNIFKNKNDFLGAILLKWLKDGVVSTIKVESKVLKKENTAIKFNGIENYNCPEIEKTLYRYMFEASLDGVLENNEFKNWCSKNYAEILSWFNSVFDYQTDAFVAHNYVTHVGRKYMVDDRLYEEAKKMKGLQLFFKEFTMIDEKEAIEVNVWKDYLIFAQILGVAKQVARQFKKLYPDVIPEDTFNDFIFIYSLSYDGVNAASSAKSRAESYNAGGGGISFGGGGGGSFGGGGGGFR